MAHLERERTGFRFRLHRFLAGGLEASGLNSPNSPFLVCKSGRIMLAQHRCLEGSMRSNTNQPSLIHHLTADLQSCHTSVQQPLVAPNYSLNHVIFSGMAFRALFVGAHITCQVCRPLPPPHSPCSGKLGYALHAFPSSSLLPGAEYLP